MAISNEEVITIISQVRCMNLPKTCLKHKYTPPQGLHNQFVLCSQYAHCLCKILLWYMQKGFCVGLYMDFDIALLLYENVSALAKTMLNCKCDYVSFGVSLSSIAPLWKIHMFSIDVTNIIGIFYFTICEALLHKNRSLLIEWPHPHLSCKSFIANEYGRCQC